MGAKDFAKKIFDSFPKDKWPFSVYYQLNDEITRANQRTSETEYRLDIARKNNARSQRAINYEQEKYIFDEKAVVMYFHGGAGNHGCEALVRTIGENSDGKKVLLSYNPYEDTRFGLNECIDTIISSTLRGTEAEHLRFPEGSIALSIGGDNYCYDRQPEELRVYNRLFNQHGIKTALLGCSIEPEIIDDPDVRKDLDQYSLITARESITYNKLVEAGITRNTKLIPDSAFLLEPETTDLPDQFHASDVIGINISSMIMNSGDSGIVRENVFALCDYILEKTPYSIALIPHVNQDSNNDMEILKEIYLRYSQPRVLLIKDNDSRKLKYCISKCRIIVCARTHASIAAYSSCVPTLVMGYSIKSKGIAQDIFGTDENYVINVKALKAKDDLLVSFKWLSDNEDRIRKHLQSVMPGYIKRARMIGEELKKLQSDLRKPVLGIADANTCTACGNCVNICSSGAVSFYNDRRGFLQTKMDFSKCTRCGQCSSVCPINIKSNKTSPISAYAGINKKDEERLSGSSGGIYPAFARRIIDSGGVVYGARSEGLKVSHDRAETIDEAMSFMGSKYQQSFLGDCFTKVRDDLESGLKVLFTGTPCQIRALNVFLHKDYPELYCVDVICHGVPSPALLETECIEISKSSGSDVYEINYRLKIPSWESYSVSYKMADGIEVNKLHGQDPFMQKYLSNSDLRGSCYNCQSKDYRSGSDITIGDYWGGATYYSRFDDGKGISAIIVKTQKGKCLLEAVSENIDIESASIDHIELCNPMLIESANQ